MTVPKKTEKVKAQPKKTPVEKDEPVNFRYGALPAFPSQRVWTRAVIILGILIYVWYSSKDGKEVAFAKQKDVLGLRGQKLDCDTKYLEEIAQYPTCVPKKCGRYVSDKLVTITEAETLLNLAKRGFSLGSSDGGASILDLHSGALSHGEKFINVYSLETSKKLLQPSDLSVYKVIRNKIQHAIAENFGIEEHSLHLTHPTFFSKINNLPSKTLHDEYWHLHVDKETYESFHYTSLLYLSDHNLDFKGGRFIFVENAMRNVTVEPRKGRVLMFSSGAENPHFVEQVLEGTRYAITISFTCDQSVAIKDPVGSKDIKYDGKLISLTRRQRVLNAFSLSSVTKDVLLPGERQDIQGRFIQIA